MQRYTRSAIRRKKNKRKSFTKQSTINVTLTLPGTCNISALVLNMCAGLIYRPNISAATIVSD